MIKKKFFQFLDHLLTLMYLFICMCKCNRSLTYLFQIFFFLINPDSIIPVLFGTIWWRSVIAQWTDLLNWHQDLSAEISCSIHQGRTQILWKKSTFGDSKGKIYLVPCFFFVFKSIKVTGCIGTYVIAA